MAKTIQIAVEQAHGGASGLMPPWHGGLYRLLDDGRVYYRANSWKTLDLPEWELVSSPIKDVPDPTHERDRSALILTGKLRLYDECAIPQKELMAALREFVKHEERRFGPSETVTL